jgi:hypothetical protein
MDCGLTVRGLDNILKWLADHQLIRVEPKASRLGTNRYTVLFSEEAQAACRASLENDDKQQQLRDKAERTSLARSRAAKSRWAKRRKGVDGNQERSVFPESPEVENTAFAEGHEWFASDTERIAREPGTGCIAPRTERIQPGTQGSHDRPLDRPDLNSPNLERPGEPSPTPSTVTSGINWSADSIVDVVDEVQTTSLHSHGHVAAALGQDEFMAEVCRVLERSDLSNQSKKSHRDRAYALAQKHGSSLFIAALECWIHNQGWEQCEIRIGTDVTTGKPKVERRTWVLDYFISSGSALRYIKRCEAAFQLGITKGRDSIEVVCRAIEGDYHLTSEQARSLAYQCCDENEDSHSANSVSQALIFAESLEAFLENPQQHLEQYYAILRGGRPRKEPFSA